MRLRDSLEAVADISPEAFEDLRRDIDPEWVLQSLQGTGTATLRKRRLPAVKQELWGIFLAYNLVRLEMQRVAADAGVEPTRISFVAALRLICDEWLWCSTSAAATCR